MTSKSIYGRFKPTYLYIKQHSITGKLYFGKTVKDPEKYLGSGKHWSRHIKKHGVEHVETIWYCLFLDQESITEFALNFSKQNNIVESDDWLNLQPENGLDGMSPETTLSEEARLNMSKSRIGKSPANKGSRRSEESKMLQSIAQTGKRRVIKTVTCPHCNKSGGATIMKRWHFDNCSSTIWSFSEW